MINALTTTPSISLPTTPQGMVASVIATAQPALARQTAASISSTVNDADVRNERRNGGARIALSAAPEFSSPATAGDVVVAPFNASGRIMGVPSLFLAQVLAQDDAGVEGVLEFYEALMALSEVKYKPSNAAKPQTPSPTIAFLQSLGMAEQLAANQNLRAPQAANVQQLSFAFMEGAQEARPAVRERAKRADVPALPASLARTEGAEAYRFSLSRSEVLAAETARPPQTLVA
jgi:hypothetical protein